jgi:hypothetical protein
MCEKGEGIMTDKARGQAAVDELALKAAQEIMSLFLKTGNRTQATAQTQCLIIQAIQQALDAQAAKITELQGQIAALRSEMSWYEEEHWIAVEGTPFNTLNWMAHPAEYAGDEPPVVEWGPAEASSNLQATAKTHNDFIRSDERERIGADLDRRFREYMASGADAVHKTIASQVCTHFAAALHGSQQQSITQGENHD